MKRLARTLLLLTAYTLAFKLAFAAASLFWHPPAGVRFAFFLLLPPVWWLPLVLADQLVDWMLDPQRWALDFRGWWQFSAFFVASAAGPWLLRNRGFKHIDGVVSLGWLMGTMLLTAIGRSLANLAWPFVDATGQADSAGLAPALLFMRLMLGDYIGMLILVPLAWMLARQPPTPEHRRSWRIDLPLIIAPTMLATTALLIGAADYQTYFFATGLCLIPATYMAFRSGWQGAAIALTSASVLIAFAGHMNAHANATVESQFFIAAAGSTVLLLGASIETLRDNRVELHRRNIALTDANQQLEGLAIQLRDTARRNLTLSEDVRRWITAELHDELGQNLTALQVHLKVAENANNGTAAVEPVRKIITQMRRSVSGLLADLRPAGLDAFGLMRALHDGALRQQIEAAGLLYRVRIDDDENLAERLHNDNQTALYRIAQEAATNTLRHARASRFDIVLRMKTRQSRCCIVLICADDGIGMRMRSQAGGIGLQGIADRALSLGGRLRIRSGNAGTRLILKLELPASGED
jgi:two-component system sensor histidine kinase UhpB